MHYREQLSKEVDVDIVREHLFAAQDLNRKLHRRIQACESVIQELNSRTEYAEKNCNDWRQRSDNWKREYLSLKRRIDALPFPVKFLVKIFL